LGTITSPLSACHDIPDEYFVSSKVANRLPPLTKWTTEILFFLFYTAVGDQLQLMAANMLYEKGWRFNKVINKNTVLKVCAYYLRSAHNGLFVLSKFLLGDRNVGGQVSQSTTSVQNSHLRERHLSVLRRGKMS